MYNSELLFSSFLKLPSQFVYLRICLTERMFIIVLTMPTAFTVCLPTAKGEVSTAKGEVSGFT